MNKGEKRNIPPKVKISRKLNIPENLKIPDNVNISDGDDNSGNYVIYYNSHLNKYIARRKVVPKPTINNELMQEIFNFAQRIDISEEYKEDCRKYIQRYNSEYHSQGKPMSTWPNVYLKVMRDMLKNYPDLDIMKLTREEIIKKNLPCQSIASAIEAGYLNKVRDWQQLNAII